MRSDKEGAERAIEEFPGVGQDLSATKLNFASTAQQLATDLIAIQRRCNEFVAFYFDNLLNSGAANAYVQADLVGAVANMTPAIVGNVVTAATGIRDTITAGIITNLHQAVTKPGS